MLHSWQFIRSKTGKGIYFLTISKPINFNIMETKPKNPNYKYWSKLYKGILKQIARQENKPLVSKVIVYPLIMSYSVKHSKYLPLKRKYYNNRFRGGKGLDAMHGDIYFNFVRSVNGMYTRCLVDRITGKYKLSTHGKQLLKSKKLKKSQLAN